MILECDDLLPGDPPSYEVCKAIYVSHVFGAKIVESPIRLAQSQDREIAVAVGPEEALVERFKEVWNALEMSRVLLNLRSQARVYGLAGVGCGERGKPLEEPIDLKTLWKSDLFFNIFDPLNIPGLIVDQNPNSPQFQKPRDVIVAGQLWNRSRVRIAQNEESIYLSWTGSAYAYSGRSSFSRCLYPLKSMLQTMITDDMVSRKAGLIVAKMESAGSIVDRVMASMQAVKRALLRQGKTNDVLSIGITETVESLNLRNVDASMREARNNIIKNIATAADLPAKLLTAKSYVEGFGEGTQDAYAVAQYIDRVRIEMAADYRWADEIVMRRAWSPEFYATIQDRYSKDYRSVDYEVAFQEWRNSFAATWPSLIKEQPSDLIQVDKAKVESVIAAVQVLAPLFERSPASTAALIRWVTDNLNSMEHMFEGAHLDFDFDDLRASFEQEASAAARQPGQLAEEEGASHPRHPFASTDAAESIVAFVDFLKGRGERAVQRQ